MAKRKKMTRKMKREQFKTIADWLEYRAKLRRINEEKMRKRKAQKMNMEFKYI